MGDVADIIDLAKFGTGTFKGFGLTGDVNDRNINMLDIETSECVFTSHQTHGNRPVTGFCGLASLISQDVVVHTTVSVN